MAITFQCPNGHRLTCPDAQAGKSGKCPKCGAVFRVPAEGAPTVAPSGAALGANGGTAPAGEGQLKEFEEHESPGDVADGEIVFLCPNGHRLHGPAEMVGRPGQCPHCSVRFLIPSPEDISEEDEEDERQDSPDGSLEEFVIQIETAAKESSVSGKSGLKSPAPPAASVPAPSVPSAPAAGGHALAALLKGLWSCKEQGASIEVHLGDGKIIIPDRYVSPPEHPAHALFAVREANGSHTLIAVAWDAIQRIAVRQLRQLPKEWFE
ncbi:MAG TPA: hypothetical protein VGN42_23710 [Pirellulales bacterium]|jgi:hypothetical protein|nr:hypothetical protein [Pirellulales bacterium]